MYMPIFDTSDPYTQCMNKENKFIVVFASIEVVKSWLVLVVALVAFVGYAPLIR